MTLIVSYCAVDQGTDHETYSILVPVGQAFKILKRSSHVTVAVKNDVRQEESGDKEPIRSKLCSVGVIKGWMQWVNIIMKML